jgi:hypothetical protein
MSVAVNIEDLFKVKNSLEESLSIINKYISQHSAQVITEPPRETTIDLFPTRTKTREDPKRPSLGPCMFVQRKNLTNVTTRDELETCEGRCNKKAFNIRSGVILCSRHRDSDIQKIEEILNQVQTSGPSESGTDILPEGDYASHPQPPPSSEIEEALAELGELEKLLEENRFIPCRIEYKDVCIITHSNIMYVIDPCGDCFGKITDGETIEEIDLASKKKLYMDVREHIQPLQVMDREFLREYNLAYVRVSST